MNLYFDDNRGPPACRPVRPDGHTVVIPADIAMSGTFDGATSITAFAMP